MYFLVDNEVLFCKLRLIKIDPERNWSITQYIRTEKHRRAMENVNKIKKPTAVG